MLNNEAIDDVPVPDATPNFAAGLASYPASTQLAVNQFALGINTSVTKIGEVQTRRAFERVGAFVAGTAAIDGLAYLDTAAGVRKLLRCRGGVCEAWDGAAWAAAGGFAPTAGKPLEIVQLLDKLYLTNGGFNSINSWDGAVFAALAISGPQYLVAATNRLIGAGGTSMTDTVWFSNILDPLTWNAANKLRVGAGDGDVITGVAMWTKNLLAVFKRTRIYIVNIDPAIAVGSMVIDEVPAGLGCLSHRSIAKVGRDLWFLASDGTVRSLSRVLEGQEQQITGAMSLPIQNELADMTEDQAATACATFFANRYLLSFWSPYPTKRKIASFNTELNGGAGGWEGIWSQTGMLNPSIFVRTKFAGRERLMAADDTDGSVLSWRTGNAPSAETIFDFTDSSDVFHAITTQVRTRGCFFGADQNLKQGFAVELECSADQPGVTATVNAKAMPDEGALVTLQAGVSGSGKSALTLLHQPPFRAMQFDLSSASGKLAVRGVRPTAFMQTMPVGQ
jgi:hypothetical protein